MTPPISLATVTAEDFSPHQDSVFLLEREEGCAAPLRLAEARALKVHRDGRRPPFALLFAGTPGEVLPQGIYRLSHPVLGVLDIFLVPIGATAEETRYEAIFN